MRRAEILPSLLTSPGEAGSTPDGQGKHRLSVPDQPTRRFQELVAFFTLAFALSWAAWLPLVLLPSVRQAPPWLYLHFLGSLGPLTAAVLVASVSGKRTIRALRAETLGGAWCWALLAALTPLLLLGVALLASVALSGRLPDVRLIGLSSEYPQLTPLLYLSAVVVCYGFGEEVGWRGFALPRLQARKPALAAAAMLTLPWAVWHLPLFAFTPGLHGMATPVGAASWLLSLLAGSVVLAWLRNSSGGVLAPALFHATLDIAVLAPMGDPLLPLLVSAPIMLWAIVLAVTCGRTLKLALRGPAGQLTRLES